MNTLTLQLPDFLYSSLQTQARTAGVSLEELIVTNLAKQSIPGYRVEATTEAQRDEQARLHAALLQSLGPLIVKEEAKRILREREHVEPEPNLDPAVVARLRAHFEKG